MKRTRPWELRDEVWERVQPLIPERPSHPKGGRPAEEDRQMLAAILYVLRTGIQWNALPRELGASTTVYDRFRRMASSKACLIVSGKRDSRNMTSWKALPGSGKAWME
jgi:transposase